MDLISLDSDYDGAIKVRPRWPYSRVLVSPEALARLEKAQTFLAPDTQFILTRGFEPGGWLLRGLHRLGRKIGGLIFVALYPSRADERAEIFSANGHDQDGNHIDVGILREGIEMRFLPFGVMSSRSQVAANRQSESAIIERAYNALQSAGFQIHSNPTESLQIHCDLVQCIIRK